MPLLRNFAGGLRDLFRKNHNQQELNEELQGFLQAAVDEKMRAGMSHEEALRAARIEMGSAAAVHDQVREAGWESRIESVWQDLRYGMRMLFKNPGFTALAVLTLALGMGATTTVFGWIDAVLLHPFPGIGHPEQIVALETLTPNGQAITTSYPDYRDFRDHLNSFSGIAVARHTSVSVGEADDAERIPAQFVSGNFFDVLEIRPALGRFFAPAEQGDQPRAFPLAVISYRLWQSHFNSDSGIIGKTIKVNEHELTVIGVTPPAFHGSMPGLAYDIWIPNVMRPLLNGFTTDWQLTDRHNRDLIAFARLKPGVNIEQARAETAALAHHMAELHPDVSEGIGATVLPMWEGHFGAQSWLLAPLEILMVACGVVLLIVCANVANLLLARFTTRQKELSMRLALGAKRSRLFRQLLTESLVLAVMGALAGVLVAAWAGRSLHHLIPPGQIPTVALDLSLNRTVLASPPHCVLPRRCFAGWFPRFTPSA
jgi:predicted permease